jgi:endonuclease YncB( thermonuclease family)
VVVLLESKLMTMWTRFIAAVLLLACAATAAPAATKTPPKSKAPPQPVELTGTVSRIVDGDTLWLRTADGSEPAVIRIEGIDAPERCQPGGKEATAALTDLALNRTVTVRVVAHDEWGRTVGKVVDGPKDIGDRMVRDGHAWSTRFKYDRGPYVAEERMAQSLKRGLHADGGAIQPREFRQRNGPCEGDAPPHAAPRAAPLPAAARPAAAAVAGPRCDGRLHCSQMTSCQEATWFLKNCPGVKMDGNRDGVPCEQQWCNARR